MVDEGVILINTNQIVVKNTVKSYRDEYVSTIILFLLPTLFFLGVFVIYPIISSFQISFLKWNGIDPVKEYIGFANWLELVHDSTFMRAVGNNFIIVILSIAIQLPISMALAVLLDNGGKQVKVFKTVYFFPMLMSSVSVGFLFKYVYDPQFGIINAFLNAAGLKVLIQDWLGDPGVALYSVIAVICWQYIPFYMIYFLAALTSIPSELREASLIDGATDSQYFWQVVLPLLKGTVKTAIVLSLVGSLKYFDLIYVMTEGGPVNATELMATYMYKNAFTTFKMGYGSTIAMALFIIVMITSISAFSITKREERA